MEIHHAYPAECERVVTSFAHVYRGNAECRKEQLSAAARLARHQAESQPVMTELKNWFTQQSTGHHVESNSGLGQAMNYLLERWDPLTRFLTVPGAPLDNNLTYAARGITLPDAC